MLIVFNRKKGNAWKFLKSCKEQERAKAHISWC